MWLSMEQVKPGLKKKLVHRWHGLSRVKKQVEELVFGLELPDRSGYRFYPAVHMSRLKTSDMARGTSNDKVGAGTRRD